MTLTERLSRFATYSRARVASSAKAAGSRPTGSLPQGGARQRVELAYDVLRPVSDVDEATGGIDRDSERRAAKREHPRRAEVPGVQFRDYAGFGMGDEHPSSVAGRGDHRGPRRETDPRRHRFAARVDPDQARLVLADNEQLVSHARRRDEDAVKEQADGELRRDAHGLFALHLLLQSLESRAQEVGHRRARRVVVEIFGRLVAGVATVKPAVPLHLAAASGRGFDHECD